MSLHCIFTVCFFTLLLCANGSEGESANFVRNKQAIERAAKIYLAFEARHEIGPGAEGDLQLPEKAKFQLDGVGTTEPWIFPAAIGLEIRVGEEQKRLIVLAPKKVGAHYLLVTEDLVVSGHKKAEVQKILTAVEKRLKKLKATP